MPPTEHVPIPTPLAGIARSYLCRVRGHGPLLLLRLLIR